MQGFLYYTGVILTMGYLRNIYGDQNIYIQGQQLKGVQGFDADFNVPLEPINVAGIGYGVAVVNSSLEGNFSVNRLVVSKEDPVAGYFGTPIDGHVKYGLQQDADPSVSMKFAFGTGYINSYSSDCDIGGIPSLDFGVTVYGDMGNGIRTDSEVDNTYDLLVAKPGDIIFSGVSGELSNRIQSYSYSVGLEHQPEYAIGSGFDPAFCITRLPIELNLEISMAVDDFRSESMQSLTCKDGVDVSVILSGCGMDSPIREFKMPLARMTNVSERSSIGDELMVDIQYKSYVSGTSELTSLVGGVNGYTV